MIENEILNYNTEKTTLQEALATLPNSSAFTRQKEIITNINNSIEDVISDFESAEQQHSILSSTTTNTDTLLDARQNTLTIVEQQLDVANENLSRIKNDNLNNHRMIEINNFYNGYYLLYLTIFRYIIYTCTFLLIVALLKTLGVITISISNVLAILIIGIGGFFIIQAVIDINYRNNVDINEYEFAVNPNINDVPAYESVQDNNISILQDLENRYSCLLNNS